MKKKTAILLSAVMALSFCFGGSFVYAEAAAETEEAPAAEELNWSDVEPSLEEAGFEGEFVTFDEIAVKMWVPEGFQEVELTEEDKENGYIGYYQTEDEKGVVSVMYVDVDGMTLEEYKEWLEGEDDVKEVTMGILNGNEAVTYESTENDTVSVALATEAGYILEFTLGYASDKEIVPYILFMVASIQPEE